MIPTAAIVAGVLTFTEPEYFGPTPELLAERESQLLDQDFEGVAVNAPNLIDTRTRGNLPLIVAARFSGERDWNLPLKDNCLLVGANLLDGTVHFAPALASRKDVTRTGRIEPHRGEKPDGLADVAAQIVPVDAYAKIPMTWNTGLWALGVIHYDWPSNMVTVELKGDAQPPVHNVRPINPPVRPGADDTSLPSYIAMGKNPRLPDSGCAFSIECRIVDGKPTLNVYGSFTLAARAHMIPHETISHELPSGRRAAVAAVVPVTCAVVGMNWDMPLQFDWAVPAYGNAARAGTIVAGYFAINAVAPTDNVALKPGEYVCYLIIDGQLVGPQRFTVPQ